MSRRHGDFALVGVAAAVELDEAGHCREARVALLKHAAKAVWGYFVQREMCGMRDHRWVINDYGITNEVMVRLGAIER